MLEMRMRGLGRRDKEMMPMLFRLESDLRLTGSRFTYLCSPCKYLA